MQKLIYILVLIFSPGVCFAMEELPQPLSNIHAQRNTRLTASASERNRSEEGQVHVVVQLTDGSSSDEGSSYSPISRTSTGALQVDIDEELGESIDSDSLASLVLLLASVQRPSAITEEESRALIDATLQEMSIHQPRHYRGLMHHAQAIQTCTRAGNFVGNLPQLNIDLSDISDATNWAAHKLLQKYNSILNDKVLTAEEQQKAAEKTEKRVKIISGIATGMICVSFVLAQVLPSALS